MLLSLLAVLWIKGAGMSSVFCDWLDITQSPDDNCYPEWQVFMGSASGNLFGDNARGYYQFPDGVAQYQCAKRFVRLSHSGGALRHIRAAGLFQNLLALLAERPHRVTRLDAALDLSADASGYIAGLRSRYPSGRVSLGRKSLSVTTILRTRDDGQESGSYYVGQRNCAARAIAKVYDKSLEQWEKRGIAMPPTTRIEVTARKDFGATLRDAAEPARLFWHLAGGVLADPPLDIEPWESGWGGSWSCASDFAIDVPARLSRLVSESGELSALISLADSLGDHGRGYLYGLLGTRLGIGSALQ